ncbi:MAG: carboxypeptidase-like regulatory domain-containing protein [Bacteroidota bacterium]
MRTILSLLFCCSICWLNAQDLYHTIKGIVIDKETRKPVSYAHVGIPSKGIGTISGYRGRFTLKIPKVYLPANLEVSFLGYKNYRKRVSSSTADMRILLDRSITTTSCKSVMDRSNKMRMSAVEDETRLR